MKLAPYTNFAVDYSPEWLFFRIRASDNPQEPTYSLAERIWAIAQQRSIYRFVVELDDDILLTSELVGQLVRLHKRAHQMGGVTRLAAFAPSSYQVLQLARLAERFPNYRDRAAAVMGDVSKP